VIMWMRSKARLAALAVAGALAAAPAIAAPQRYEVPGVGTVGSAREAMSCPKSVTTADGVSQAYRGARVYYLDPIRNFLLKPTYEGDPNVYTLSPGYGEAANPYFYAQCVYGGQVGSETAWLWLRKPGTVTRCVDTDYQGLSCQ